MDVNEWNNWYKLIQQRETTQKWHWEEAITWESYLNVTWAGYTPDWKQSARMKWQERCTDRGRTLYQYRPTVCYKFKGVQFHSFTGKRRISQLRTGYVPLNFEYLHKCGLKDTKECNACGDVESVQHYLLSCPEYEKRDSANGLVSSSRNIKVRPQFVTECQARCWL